jgi:hypothetical protein
MNKIYSCFFVLLTVLVCSCAASKKNYNPAKKYAPEVLQKDFILLKNILEEKHPSLYWYMPKEKMDQYFIKYYDEIRDSMTEQNFAWHVLAPLIQKIHCGHTSVSMSKAYSKWVRGKAIPAFPLYMKIWNDTMAVTANLNWRKDTVFQRGTLITSINGIPNNLLIKYMMEFLPEDGYANNVNYIRLSGNFPYFHRTIFGLSKSYNIGYLDSNNVEQKITVPLFIPQKDSLRKDSIIRKEKKHMPIEKKILQYRSLSVDSSGKFATMTLNTFSDGHLRNFFRRSFKKLRKEKINHLVLDLRSNGGGRVGMSTLLTKYISRKRFKVADSLFTQSRGLGPYTKYVKGGFLNNIEMFFASRKKADGNYHIGHLERKLYELKGKNHFNGQVYVLTNGPTFSASALFCNAVKGQQDITLLGEETGGGWYGNDGIMIPDITLPNTHVRVRLPLFRLVQYNHKEENKGKGIPPDIFVGTSYDALLNGYDKKLEVVRELIMAP